MARQCIERYKDPRNFLRLFSPDKQYAYTRDLRKVYMGQAPSLGTLTKAWGEELTESWLQMQIIELSEFSGARYKPTPFQLDSISRVIMATWGYFKVSELMHFFLLLKSGMYGKFYGAVDASMITEALRKFEKDRYQIISKYEQEQQERDAKLEKERSRKEAQRFRDAMKVCHMTIPEWLTIGDKYDLTIDEIAEVGWLFRMGYERQEVVEEQQRQNESFSQIQGLMQK